MSGMKYILALISTLCLMSCGDDFLDKTDPTTLVASGFYKTEAQLQQAVNGVYGQLQGITSGQWLYGEFPSDNTTLHFNTGDRGQGPDIEAEEFWQLNSGTLNIATLYSSLYLSLVNINTTLVKLSNSSFDATLKSQYEGELKFLRGYYYFLLVQYFGEVIIMTEPLRVPTDAYAYVRQPVEDVYALVKSDLNFAVNALPPSYDAANKGRATRGAALSLLGKVQLTRKEYAGAVTTLQQVLSMGYALLPDYADVFDPQKKNHTQGEGSNFIYTFAPLFSDGAVINFPRQNGGGWNIPSRDMIAAYEAGDLRKDVSLKEGYTSKAGAWVPVPFINKYNHPHTIRGVTNDNWPVLRYADVLLMLAEAMNEESGPTAEAYGYLNEVRTRADLDELSGLDKTAFRAAVLQERRVELAFENHRWFDLKRTKTPDELATFLNAYAAVEKSNPTTSRGGIPFTPGDYQFSPYEALFPIPANERRININLTQNPGYN
jgi:hypothetical protein